MPVRSPLLPPLLHLREQLAPRCDDAAFDLARARHVHLVRQAGDSAAGTWFERSCALQTKRCILRTWHAGAALRVLYACTDASEHGFLSATYYMLDGNWRGGHNLRVAALRACQCSAAALSRSMSAACGTLVTCAFSVICYVTCA